MCLAEVSLLKNPKIGLVIDILIVIVNFIDYALRLFGCDLKVEIKTMSLRGGTTRQSRTIQGRQGFRISKLCSCNRYHWPAQLPREGCYFSLMKSNQDRA
jgi:hypothetical protein